MDLTEQEQKFLDDVREKNPELLEDVKAALESEEGGLILDGDEVVGFSFGPVPEGVVVNDGSR